MWSVLFNLISDRKSSSLLSKLNRSLISCDWDQNRSCFLFLMPDEKIDKETRCRRDERHGGMFESVACWLAAALWQKCLTYMFDIYIFFRIHFFRQSPRVCLTALWKSKFEIHVIRLFPPNLVSFGYDTNPQYAPNMRNNKNPSQFNRVLIKCAMRTMHVIKVSHVHIVRITKHLASSFSVPLPPRSFQTFIISWPTIIRFHYLLPSIWITLVIFTSALWLIAPRDRQPIGRPRRRVHRAISFRYRWPFLAVCSKCHREVIHSRAAGNTRSIPAEIDIIWTFFTESDH